LCLFKSLHKTRNFTKKFLLEKFSDACDGGVAGACVCSSAVLLCAVHYSAGTDIIRRITSGGYQSA